MKANIAFMSTKSTAGTGTTGNKPREKCKVFFDDLAGNVASTLTNAESATTGYCAGFLDGTVSVEQPWNSVEAVRHPE
jgi:hypothetical protein